MQLIFEKKLATNADDVLATTRELNHEDLTVSVRLWIEDNGIEVRFTAAPRIGIGCAAARDRRRRRRCTLKTGS